MEDEKEQLYKIQDRNFERGFQKGFAIFLIVAGVLVFIVFLFSTLNGNHPAKTGESPDMASSGQFGDFIGGVVGSIFSLAGVILLYITLRAQRENFHRERLESNFFEMIRFHRANVDEIRYNYFDYSGPGKTV